LLLLAQAAKGPTSVDDRGNRQFGQGNTLWKKIAAQGQRLALASPLLKPEIKRTTTPI